MIISISGAQGQGKTTTRNALMTTYEQLSLGANNIARTVMQEWNKSLDEINSNIKLKMMFQDKIADKQYEIESKLPQTTISISERSYADMFVYALITLGSFNNCSKWLNMYYGKCCKFQANYKKIFFLTGREYIPENDGIRSINKLYGNMVETMVYQYLNEFTENNMNQEIIKIDTIYTEDRVTAIANNLDINCIIN